MDLLILPADLQAKGITLSGETAWPKEAARDVIEFLERNHYAVLGVELWSDAAGAAQVLGWSDYSIAFSEDWDEYVRLNAQQARQVLENPSAENGLFNLTWAERHEV